MLTAAEIITRVDEDKLNAYNTEQKIRWIDYVNKKAYLLGLKGEEETYTPITQLTDELLIGEPYDQAYDYYIYSKIDLLNNEITNYNNSALLYNTTFSEYIKAMIRLGHLEKQPTFKNIEP